MGDLFSQIAVREKFAANEAFTIFADAHRNYHRAGTEFQKKAAPVCFVVCLSAEVGGCILSLSQILHS